MNRENDVLFLPDRCANARRLLAVIERVKAAVQLFEDGEINLEDAVRQIADTVAARKAA
jgi:hypothetical protein